MQHQAYLLQCLLAAALCSGASVASDSASELSDDCSGPESADWEWRMNGGHGEFAGLCNKAAQTCTYKVKHGMWGNTLWINGADVPGPPKQPVPPTKYAWWTKDCHRRAKCQKDGDLCAENSGQTICHYGYGMEDLVWNQWWDSDSDRGGPSSDASRSWRSSKRKSSGGSRSSSTGSGSSSSSRRS